jgi:hypothetical protein
MAVMNIIAYRGSRGLRRRSSLLMGARDITFFLRDRESLLTSLTPMSSTTASGAGVLLRIEWARKQVYEFVDIECGRVGPEASPEQAG